MAKLNSNSASLSPEARHAHVTYVPSPESLRGRLLASFGVLHGEAVSDRLTLHDLEAARDILNEIIGLAPPQESA